MYESVLVTGGTGSFGRAFVARMLWDSVPRICVFSRDEWKQAQMREALGNKERLHWFVGDVRDRDRLRRAFHGVELVVHAAALKRIEVGHYNPMEMVKTNVLGTMNVVEAAIDAGVKRVIFLSSDKAYQPISPYGQSKALAETIVLNANNWRGADGPSFAVTRYGNVAGSTGSVIPVWRQMLKEGKTRLPVTRLEATRFWMTMHEAVDLVLTAADETLARGYVPYVPVLPAYQLCDLCIAMGGVAEEIGLPPWEKLHECMGPGNCSDTARRMTVDELKEALVSV